MPHDAAPYRMKNPRISVEIDEATLERMKRLAEVQGNRSLASLGREAIVWWLARPESQPKVEGEGSAA